MPRARRFRIAAIDDLFRQLRFAPRATRVREMKKAEALAGDVEPDRNYPQEFVTFRITGYRPEPREEPITFVGAALLSDLVIFVQRLSEGLELGADFDGRTARPLDEVATVLNVSTKTLQRYREQGLVCHYILFPDGVTRLACFDDALFAFVEGHRTQIARASKFTRVADDVQREIVEDARLLHAAESLSLNEVALRLARRHDRAHETVRNILRRHDRRAAGGRSPIFAEHGPLSERDARLIHRAMHRGVPVRVLAHRFGKTPATIRRHQHRRRRAVLREVELCWVDLPTFELPEAETVILAAPAVTGDLDRLLPIHDALALLEVARGGTPPDETEEHALVAGYNLLKRRASGAIAALPDWASAEALEAIDRDLRWAIMLKRRLVSLGLPSAVARIEQAISNSLVRAPAHRIVHLLHAGCSVVSAVVDTLDPGRGQRLDRVATYAMDLALARAPVSMASTSAAARHEAGSIRLDDLFVGLAYWERLVELRPDLRPLVGRLEATRAEAVRLHYGLGSVPPFDTRALAERLDRSAASVTRLLRGAVTALRALRRAEASAVD